MKCSQTSHVEHDQFLHWSQRNTFPVLHAFIVNVKLSARWIDLVGNPIYIYISACMSFIFLKKSSSANGTNVLFL